MFGISDKTLNRDELHSELANSKAGAIVVFEGWVRNHNQGKEVLSLEYQVYKELALKEGEKILAEAKEKFNLHDVVAVHREGHLNLGEIAIWIGATASHRGDAFAATRYVIDEIKHRLPVWKKEHYVAENPEWVMCRDHHHHVHFHESDYYEKQAKLVDQKKLKAARVLVVGAGGLGNPALVNLAMAGVGSIGIVDFDKISFSNLHRQFLFTPNLVGEKKAVVAKNRISELNPFINVKSFTESFKPSHVEGYDLVLDCTDNMEAKYFIHDVCFKARRPLISAGIFKFEGQVRTFDPSVGGCLRCHGGETPDDSLLGNCNDFGVLGVTTSVLGSMQASEAVEFILNGRNSSVESTLYFNVKTLSQMKVKNTAVEGCLTCLGQFELQANTLEVESVEEGKLIDIREMSDEQIFTLNFTGAKTVLCCHRGNRSRRIVADLRSRGHEHVYSLRGGASSLNQIGSGPFDDLGR